MQRIRKALNNQRGVTLIELLAVVVILGIVAAVAVPAVLNQIDGSKEEVSKTNAQIINDAAERYYMYNSDYPDATDAEGAIVILQTTESDSDSDGEMDTNIGGPFLKSDFPTTPETGSWAYSKTTGKVTWTN